MAHAFDTGLLIPQRQAIRDAVLARLDVLVKKPVGGLYVRALKTIPGELSGGSESGLVEIAHHTQGELPAVLIALGGKTPTRIGGDGLELEVTYKLHVYVASSHQKDDVVGRLYSDSIAAGDLRADPGLFTMLEHVEELLVGQELGLDGIGALVQTDEDELALFADLSVWHQEYEVPATKTINPQRGITQLLLSIQADHNLDTPTEVVEPILTTITTLDPPEDP